MVCIVYGKHHKSIRQFVCPISRRRQQSAAGLLLSSGVGRYLLIAAVSTYWLWIHIGRHPATLLPPCMLSAEYDIWYMNLVKLWRIPTYVLCKQLNSDLLARQVWVLRLPRRLRSTSLIWLVTAFPSNIQTQRTTQPLNWLVFWQILPLLQSIVYTWSCGVWLVQCSATVDRNVDIVLQLFRGSWQWLH